MKRASTVLMTLIAAALVSCTPETAVSASSVPWLDDLEAAKTAAGKDGAKKVILVDFTTDWCGWCKKLDRDVFSKEAFHDKVSDKFVLVKINPETSDKNRKIAEKYGVRGFPTLVFLKADGELAHKVVGYKPLDDFLKEMDTARKSALGAAASAGS
jgi:thioredoxin-related protein